MTRTTKDAHDYEIDGRSTTGKSRWPVILGVLAIGILIGLGQGYMQCEHNWHRLIVERSTCYDQEGPVPIYEDQQGNVYYAHREQR